MFTLSSWIAVVSTQTPPRIGYCSHQNRSSLNLIWRIECWAVTFVLIFPSGRDFAFMEIYLHLYFSLSYTCVYARTSLRCWDTKIFLGYIMNVFCFWNESEQWSNQFNKPTQHLSFQTSYHRYPSLVYLKFCYSNCPFSFSGRIRIEARKLTLAIELHLTSAH